MKSTEGFTHAKFVNRNFQMIYLGKASLASLSPNPLLLLLHTRKVFSILHIMSTTPPFFFETTPHNQLITQWFTKFRGTFINLLSKRPFLSSQTCFLFFLKSVRTTLPTYKVEYKLSTFKLRSSKYEIYYRINSLLPNCNKNYGFDSKFGNKIALIAWYYKLNK